MEYSELKQHEARAELCAEATIPGDDLRALIRSSLNPFCYCRNCEKPTEHSRRGYDLCCDVCHFIAVSFHERPATIALAVRGET